MRCFLRNNWLWLLIYLLFLIVATMLLLSCNKASLHLALNACHTPWLDVLMKQYTLFVVWPVYVLIVSLIFYKTGWAYFIAIAELATAVIVHIVKPLTNMPRPISFFAETFGDASFLPLVDGVKMNLWQSFPSGHTAAFFAFFVPLVLLLTNELNNRRSPYCSWVKGLLQIVLLALAILGGYSRIYLSQHFLLDVSVGSLIAVLVSLSLYAIFAVKGWFSTSWFVYRVSLRK